MKTLPVRFLLTSALLLALVLACRGEAQESDNSTTSIQAEFHPIESVFIDRANDGVDPFFPHSKRREVKIQESPQETKAVVSRKILESLKLKGISGTEDRKIALINSRTFEAGEVAELQLPEGTARIRCESITFDSVVVSLVGEGIRKQLFLDEPTIKLN